MSAAAIAFHTGVTVDETPSRIVGFSVTVPDVDALERRLADKGVPARRRGGDLVVDPADAFGCLVVFRAAA